ncbi:hypothetical protein BS50DRAFT_597872 [Corynespora cassiicola Philippines]|uniref:RraA-like protein n=1 Tax=Corynespora cassiicola Philippines TaxID=1448308 RepID=A0A2T2P4Q4_CORCC|nr:hypothetical protein BS50DRAFT_597872 [Corynespora cassiicola Philippines]
MLVTQLPPLASNTEIRDDLVRLHAPHSGYLSELNMLFPKTEALPKLFGPAYAVCIVPAHDTISPKPSSHFAYAIPPDSICYISACCGGLMNTRAQKHCTLGFGLLGNRTSILGSGTFTRLYKLNVRVSYRTKELQEAQVEIRPKNMVLGDAYGVIAVPPKLAEECFRLCDARWNIDQATRECLAKGENICPSIQRF